MKISKKILVGLILSLVVLPSGFAAVRPNSRVGVSFNGPAAPRLPSLPPTTVTSDVQDTIPETPKYSVDACMTAVSSCVRANLNGGLNELYDADARNDILSDTNFCSAQINYCIENVYVNNRPVYTNSRDVWMDFNSRVIQPEYYDFVIRNTGLSPVQAEQTCMLLGVTTNENVSESLLGRVSLSGQSKWTSVNDMANDNTKWNAANAQCSVRVRAYNKNNPITNSWLFGIAGDDRVAESWHKTGDVFTCNKDLFGFGLMTNTKTVAVVGIGGGTLVGGATGAIIGHNQQRDFSCDNENDRKELANELFQSRIKVEFSDGSMADGSQELTQKACLDIQTLRIENKEIAALSVWQGQDSKVLSGALIGAGSGAAAGGLATLITSFVERNNISCRIGNNIDQIGYNKSASIDTLKNYYVKWNLGIPEVFEPNTIAQTCDTFKGLCGEFKDAYHCSNAQVRFKPHDATRPIAIMGACLPYNGACATINSVALSNAICE